MFLYKKKVRANYRGGQTMLLLVVLALFISLTLVAGMSASISRKTELARSATVSKASYFLSEALHEDVVYRILHGKQYGATETLTLDGNTATSTITSLSGSDKQVVTVGNINNDTRRIQSKLVVGVGAAFHYGMQVGIGGLEMNNSSSVVGNVFANGPITGSGNIVRGSVVSAGPSGLVDSIHATSSVYAHTITGSTVDKDAYYMSISGTTVGGVSYPGSADQATSSLPISDAQITDWENGAAAGGVINTCPYTISSDTTLGPVKINCDVSISGSAVVSLTGDVWVKGNVTVSNSATIRVDPSMGGYSAALIADNPSNSTGSGEFNLGNSSTYVGSGTTGSYLLLISQNNSSETGGIAKAISISNNNSGDVLLYAGHGLIDISNSSELREVTGYKIRTSNSAEIIYKTGLANLLFEAGPAGGYLISQWLEVP